MSRCCYVFPAGEVTHVGKCFNIKYAIVPAIILLFYKPFYTWILLENANGDLQEAWGVAKIGGVHEFCCHVCVEQFSE